MSAVWPDGRKQGGWRRSVRDVEAGAGLGLLENEEGSRFFMKKVFTMKTEGC